MMVPLLWSESFAVIKTRKSLRIDVPNIVRVVVKVQKVLKFEGVRKSFDRDLKLNFNFQLFGLVLLMDGDSIVAIICYSYGATA